MKRDRPEVSTKPAAWEKHWPAVLARIQRGWPKIDFSIEGRARLKG